MSDFAKALATRRLLSFEHGGQTFYLREPDFSQLEEYGRLDEEQRTDAKYAAKFISQIWVTAEGERVASDADRILELPAAFVAALIEQINNLVNVNDKVESAAKN